MTYVMIGTLEPGTRVMTHSGTVATLLYSNPSRARVRIGEPTKKVITRQPKGIGVEAKSYAVTVPAHETDWGYSTLVRVLASGVSMVPANDTAPTVRRGRPPVDPVKRREWDAANDRARALREQGR